MLLVNFNLANTCAPHVYAITRARAHVFGGINFGDLVKNSPIRQIKIPTKVSGYTVICIYNRKTKHLHSRIVACVPCPAHCWWRATARAQCQREGSLDWRRLKLTHTWQLRTVTDKGRLLTDSNIKSRVRFRVRAMHNQRFDWMLWWRLEHSVETSAKVIFRTQVGNR